MKSMGLPLAAIFSMTYVYRAGEGEGMPPWIGYCGKLHNIVHYNIEDKRHCVNAKIGLVFKRPSS